MSDSRVHLYYIFDIWSKARCRDVSMAPFSLQHILTMAAIYENKKDPLFVRKYLENISEGLDLLDVGVKFVVVVFKWPLLTKRFMEISKKHTFSKIINTDKNDLQNFF